MDTPYQKALNHSFFHLQPTIWLIKYTAAFPSGVSYRSILLLIITLFKTSNKHEAFALATMRFWFPEQPNSFLSNAVSGNSKTVPSMALYNAIKVQALQASLL